MAELSVKYHQTEHSGKQNILVGYIVGIVSSQQSGWISNRLGKCTLLTGYLLFGSVMYLYSWILFTNMSWSMTESCCHRPIGTNRINHISHCGWTKMFSAWFWIVLTQLAIWSYCINDPSLIPVERHVILLSCFDNYCCGSGLSKVTIVTYDFCFKVTKPITQALHNS